MRSSSLLGAAAALLASPAAAQSSCSPTELFTNFGDSPDQMMVGWATTCQTDSTLKFGLSPSALTKTVNGSSASYSLQGGSYVSPYIHHALMTGLPASTLIYYQVGSASAGWSAVQNVTSHPGVGVFPVRFGIVGDLGQTSNSADTIQHLMQGAATSAAGGAGAIPWNSILLVGDLSYADLYGPRWDSWQQLVQPMTAQLPMMAFPGNHEIELDTNLQTFESYKARFWMPQIYYNQPQQRRDLYYSINIGPVHFIALNSYSDYTSGSAQYQWLQSDFASIDKSQTPFILVGLHATWYNSNYAHQGEGNPMREAMEGLFFANGVDLVLAGHVHAYERNHRVFNNSLNAAGPYYITIGDGGNREGLATSWITPQPAVSAFRQSTFGHGVLSVYNATHAFWEWHADPDVENAVRDSLWIIKGQDGTVAEPKRTITTRLREKSGSLIKDAAAEAEAEVGHLRKAPKSA